MTSFFIRASLSAAVGLAAFTSSAKPAPAAARARASPSDRQALRSGIMYETSWGTRVEFVWESPLWRLPQSRALDYFLSAVFLPSPPKRGRGEKHSAGLIQKPRGQRQPCPENSMTAVPDRPPLD